MVFGLSLMFFFTLFSIARFRYVNGDDFVPLSMWLTWAAVSAAGGLAVALFGWLAMSLMNWLAQTIDGSFSTREQIELGFLVCAATSFVMDAREVGANRWQKIMAWVAGGSVVLVAMYSGSS